MCRFFSTAFGEKSSHFYTPDAPECGVVKASPSWTFEAEVFHVVYPAFDGSCPASTVPVYRMYNDGQGGAPNHRYTTEHGSAQRDAGAGLDRGRRRDDRCHHVRATMTG